MLKNRIYKEDGEWFFEIIEMRGRNAKKRPFVLFRRRCASHEAAERAAEEALVSSIKKQAAYAQELADGNRPYVW